MIFGILHFYRNSNQTNGKEYWRFYFNEQKIIILIFALHNLVKQAFNNFFSGLTANVFIPCQFFLT